MRALTVGVGRAGDQVPAVVTWAVVPNIFNPALIDVLECARRRSNSATPTYLQGSTLSRAVGSKLGH